MKIFIAGATGATGKLLTEILLTRGHNLIVVVRSAARIPDRIRKHENIEIVKASLLDLSNEELTRLTVGCDAIVSCLGHNLSWKGVFGPPYKLVTEATRRLFQVAGEDGGKGSVRFILMSSTGVRNPDEGERISIPQHVVIQLLRWFLPPHADNEAAAAFLRHEMKKESSSIEWVAVRPDSLTDEKKVSLFSVHRSPTRSAIFDSGKISRINVASFMADLLEQDDLWNRWKSKMPVIYNAT